MAKRDLTASERRGATNPPSAADQNARAALEGTAAALAAVAIMAALSAIALSHFGIGEDASVPAVAAAMVTLAVGGSVSLDAGASGMGRALGSGVQGTLELMPLGISLAGAVVFVIAFSLPLRRQGPGPGRLTVRAAAAVGAFTVAITVLAMLGRGPLRLAELGPWSAAPGGGLRGGRLRDHLGGGGGGGLRDRLGGHGLRDGLGGGGLRGGLGGDGGQGSGELLRGSAAVQFHADVSSALANGLVWAAVVLALGWLVWRRAPLPSGWGWAHRIRPALSATATVLVTLMSIGTAAGLVLSVFGENGSLAGGLLLGAATGVLVTLALGIGVPWSASAGGAAAELLPADRIPDGTLSLASLPTGRPLWILPVGFAMVTLLVCGVLAAARGPSAPTGGRLSHAVAAGGRLGVIVAIAMAVLTILAAGSMEVGVSLLGTELLGTEVSLHANSALAAASGLAGGAVSGFAGSLLWELFGSTRAARALKE